MRKPGAEHSVCLIWVGAKNGTDEYSECITSERQGRGEYSEGITSGRQGREEYSVCITSARQGRGEYSECITSERRGRDEYSVCVTSERQEGDEYSGCKNLQDERQTNILDAKYLQYQKDNMANFVLRCRLTGSRGKIILQLFRHTYGQPISVLFTSKHDLGRQYTMNLPVSHQQAPFRSVYILATPPPV